MLALVPRLSANRMLAAFVRQVVARLPAECTVATLEVTLEKRNAALRAAWGGIGFHGYNGRVLGMRLVMPRARPQAPAPRHAACGPALLEGVATAGTVVTASVPAPASGGAATTGGSAPGVETST